MCSIHKRWYAYENALREIFEPIGLYLDLRGHSAVSPGKLLKESLLSCAVRMSSRLFKVPVSFTRIVDIDVHETDIA